MLMEHGADVDLQTEMYDDGSTESTPLLLSGFCDQYQRILAGALLKYGTNWEYYHDVHGYDLGYIKRTIIAWRRWVTRHMGSSF